MSMSDPIADLLTRIRNAQMVAKQTVSVPSSKVKVAIAQVLKDEGYIDGFEVKSEGGKSELEIALKYYAGRPVIERELKREKLVAKYAKKHAELKAIAGDAKRSDDERAQARLALQKLPRNANPTRQRNRCEMTGRPRGTFRQFGLGRAKIRELAFEGQIPGVTKASW